jgi:beta-lactamase regulating signal transducer with metallopeptidase domain
MSDALLILVAANLAAAAAVALVMILRATARRLFGARIAYGLWLLVPLAALGMLLPSRVVTVTMATASAPAADAQLPAMHAAAALASADAFDPWLLAAGVWIAGAVANLAWMAWRQAQFARDAEAGRAGPAAVGLLRPRVVTPSDFGRRYSPREQFVVLAHEETHIARQDTRINALVAAARCVNWFNPMLHVLARFLRIDQELACDAQVIARHPKVRRAYAEAMLKTQLAARPLPLGCYWLAATPHPLAERIRLLARPTPHRTQHAMGVAVLGALCAAAVGSTWASKPAELIVVEAPEPSRPAPRLVTPRAFAPRPIAELRGSAPAPKALDAVPLEVELADQAVDPATVTAEAQADALAGPAIPETDRPRPAFERPPRLPRERRVYALANRSSVEPGSAVRVIATAVDPEGRPLMADLTSFGSQHYYRTGSYISSGSRQGVFTSVVQRGDRLWVTASLNRRFDPDETATVEMRPGETRNMVLANGQTITVTPTLRPETPEEAAGDHEALRRVDNDIDRSSRDAWRTYRDHCRREAC